MDARQTERNRLMRAMFAGLRDEPVLPADVMAQACFAMLARSMAEMDESDCEALLVGVEHDLREAIGNLRHQPRRRTN